MTFVSLAEVCRRLGIDAKTLRRWLADAQLPLQSHPRDGRKKGVSHEHLQALARLHHRSLALGGEEPPAPLPGEMPPLPAALLALPERLGALQAQIASLQQQVALLTRLLQQHGQEPATPAAPTQPTRTAMRLSKPAPPAPRSRPTASAAAKPPRKPAHVLPRVEYGGAGHYVVICPKQGLLAFEPDSPAWFRWLAAQSSFRFVGKCGRLTAHHEGGRVPRGAWRAHRHIRNHSYTLRLAPTHDLTIAVLEQAAATLQAHLR
jgi:transposase-like protein